jgi:putative ABC transport system permease protein
MIPYRIKLLRPHLPFWKDGWVWRMAWRDARHNYPRLVLLIASLITGIAAVVAVGSLTYSLQDDLDRNARELLGADLVVNAGKKFEPEVLAAFDSLNVPQASNAELASMVLFKNSGRSRLVRVMGMEGAFPFYGAVVTAPADAFAKIKTGRYAVLDEALAVQYEISSGDSVQVGQVVLEVAGVVQQFPGTAGILTTFTPTVYVAQEALDSAGLIQFGSRVTYRRYFKTATPDEAEKTGGQLQPLLRKYGHGYDTVAERKEELGAAFQSVYRFFSLLACIALLLGCLGVASSVHIYARGKREEVAILRCLGSTGWQAFTVYFVQIFFVGLAGSLVGAGLGLVIQQVVPVIFKDFVPAEITLGVSWRAAAEGLVLGVVISALFSLLPLVPVRFVPPLTVLRTEAKPARVFSKTGVLAAVLVTLFPFAVSAYQTRSWLTGAAFTAGVAVALGCLALVAATMLKLIRRFFPAGAAFVFRHALANLFRPNNQTTVLMVTIGLGAFIIATLNIVQSSLLSQVEFSGNENQSNTILFDIQPSQRDGVVDLIRTSRFPVNQVVPIVTCRLAEVKGRTIDSLQQDTTDNIPNWALTREYRVTYRDSLHVSESLLRGDLHRLDNSSRDSVWVTLSEGMHESLGLDVNDSLVFDVQGVPVRARIAGIRKVEWQKDPPNFIFVFPSGVLENAPQIWVAATQVKDVTAGSRFQQELMARFPNVSLIDLRLILSTINQLFEKVGMVIRFLALFSMLTGLAVLAGAVMNSRFARMKENVLLRTVGARSKQIVQITLIEYAYLGLFAALTGILLALLAGILLAVFFFEVTFSFSAAYLAAVGAGVAGLTVAIGWFNSRAVVSTPPLQVLRKEN